MDRTVLTVASLVMEALDTPVSLSVYLMMKHGEWDQLARKSIDPRSYTAADSYKLACDYKATELLRKFPGLPVDIDRVAVAKQAFFSSEKKCCKSNLRLHSYVHNPSSEECDVRILKFLQGVRRRVRRILGRLPDGLNPRFGPGATFESRSFGAPVLTLGDKLEMGIHLTPSAIDLSGALYESAWGRGLVRECPSLSAPRIVRGNRFFTVPKDALKDRGACAEPGGNVALQLAVGRVIRERLLRAGIDLRRGQEIHGQKVVTASREGDVATIDLASASDSICRNLVKLLLPEDWFLLVSSLRSPTTEVDGRVYWLEKFSSMGNGFTFELETLIFWALTQECVGEDFHVLTYGDDIMIPTKSARDVIACLEFFGFEVNTRKTFFTGYFRESCGTDSFNGEVLRTFRWDSVPIEPSDWISVHNGLKHMLSDVITDKAESVFRHVLGALPRVVRQLRGPRELGDLVLHDPNPQTWIRKWKNSIRKVAVWQPVTPKVPIECFRLPVQFALALYGVPSDGLAPRRVGGYRQGWVEYS